MGSPWLARLLLAVGLAAPASALDNGLCQTPPMGFNSYMSGLGGEAGLRGVAKFLASTGLQRSGYTTVNTDEGWENKTRDPETGKLQWSTHAYPSTLPAFIRELNGMGFAYGIYGAASGVTCGKYPGQLYYEDLDAQTYVEWGVSYLKSDNCASYALDSSVRFGAMRDALNRTGKRVVLSIEPFSMTPDPEVSVMVSNLARIGCDIRGDIVDVLDRADTSDKWSPLAQHGYFNDPDMINVQNPPKAGSNGGLTLGQNRIYFGLWCLMKSPLLLSANLPALEPDVIQIVNNTELISVNQDPLAVQARKLSIDGQPLPWLAALGDCARRPDQIYTRALDPKLQGVDPRKWVVEPVAVTAGRLNASQHHTIRNAATDRCLTALNGTVALLPCNQSAVQAWSFEKGLTTVTSIANAATGLALAVSNSTLFAQVHKTDAFPVNDAAYGYGGLVLAPVFNQDGCSSRSCENYDPSQMFYWSPGDGFLRQATYSHSIDHRDEGRGYQLTPKVPTWRHHCVEHALSVGNVPTQAGTLEVWGGPLADNCYVLGLLNRGTATAPITAEFAMLGVPDLGPGTSMEARDLWQRTDLGTAVGSITRSVPGNDLAVVRICPSSSSR